MIKSEHNKIKRPNELELYVKVKKKISFEMKNKKISDVTVLKSLLKDPLSPL